MALSLNKNNAVPVLRIKTPERKPIIAYEKMKEMLIEDGLFDYDEILTDDVARSVCIFKKEGIKFVMKLGNHEPRGDTTKFNLLKNEDKVYLHLYNKLGLDYPKYFPAIIDSGSSGEKFYYIIMEFIEGKTLYDYVIESYKRNASRSKTEVFTILLNLTKGLEAMYSTGIVHGDLSVENVMIEKGLSVKLIDFEKSSKDNKLAVNTIGSTRLNVNRDESEGIGYFFLVLKLLSIIKPRSVGLIASIKNVIEDCEQSGKCVNVYAECVQLIREALNSNNVKTRRNKKLGSGRTIRASR
jgi:serine/threonine protein kinase